MYLILLFIVIGVGAGFIIRHFFSIGVYAEKLLTITIYPLLFTLGLKAGTDPKIMGQLHTLGLTALLITIFTVTGSILVAWLVYSLFFKKGIDEK